MAKFEGSRSEAGKIALRFVLMIGVVSFFADFVYEGGRSIAGSFLATLGASGGSKWSSSASFRLLSASSLVLP
jgi:hypothetical protein